MKMENQKHEWPIHPLWLSIQKDVSESKAKPNFEGVFRPDYLRGFIADTSDDQDIKNPISLFQIIPKDYVYEDINSSTVKIEHSSIRNSYIKGILKDRDIIRIDPGGLYQNISCCNAFRACGDKEKSGKSCTDKCFDLDSRIAFFYHPDLASIHFNDEYDRYVETLGRIIMKYNQSMEDDNVEYKKYKISSPTRCEDVIKGEMYRSVYVHYRCVYSELNEYFFPVIHSGRVIAVIMQGQRPHPDLKKENMFKDYRDETEAGKDLTKSVEALDDVFFAGLSLGKSRQKAILGRIHDLEIRTNDAVLSSAQRYVSEKSGKIEQEYRDRLNADNDDDNEENLTNNTFSKRFSSVLNEALLEIFRTFNQVGFIRLFTRKSELEIDDSSMIEFSLIGNAVIGEKSDNFKDTVLRFKPSLPSHDIKDPKVLEEYLAHKIPLRDGHIFRLKTQFGKKMGYVVWKEYDSWTSSYPEQFELYAKSLMAMYPSLLEPYFILRSLELEDNLVRTMRFTVHESRQVIPLVIDSINTYETKRTVLEGISTKQAFNLEIPSYTIIDTTHRLMLLERLFSTSTRLFKKESVKLKSEDLHRIIYSTDSLFAQKAFVEKEQNLKIEFDSRLQHYNLKTDYGFMSHILFNLIDNAIKYGFRGTNVILRLSSIEDELSWAYKETRIKELQLSVINYGNEIKESDQKRIFDLYFRPESSKEVEGMGIGLFLVQRLCNVMEYKVVCKQSIPIKGINIPYYYYYKKSNPVYEDKGLSKQTLHYLNSFIEKSKIEEVVNLKIAKWRIPDFELEKNLDTSIYKNEFLITIPVNKDTLIESKI